MTWNKQKSDLFKKIAVAASISTAVILFIIKMIAALMTGSIAVLSSLVDSLADIAASVISFVAVRFSLKPASCRYRYGYFKAEALSALMQAALIAGSGLFVLYNGVDRLFNPMPLQQLGVGIGVMALSLGLSVALIAFQQFVVKHTASVAIKADSAHYITDILTNLATLLSLLIVRYFKWQIVDIITAFAIAAYLLFYAYKIAAEAVKYLMDQELDEHIRAKVIDLIQKTSGIKGFHDLRTRDLGGIYYFELHLEMDGDLTLTQAHRLSDTVEAKIKTLYPDAQILIHQDPFGIKENRLDDALQNCQGLK
ncbi:MAG: cation diffusion facilitator family transporter [Alphaproteobacteria bacterium]|nr:cation diffusion facilitator family transporter [Alphaproteobacteria bacterium]